jgi:hypothetical protein
MSQYSYAGSQAGSSYAMRQSSAVGTYSLNTTGCIPPLSNSDINAVAQTAASSSAMNTVSFENIDIRASYPM